MEDDEIKKKTININVGLLLVIICLLFGIGYGIDILNHFETYTTFQKWYKTSICLISFLNGFQYIFYKYYIIKDDDNKIEYLFINSLMTLIILFVPIGNIIAFILTFTFNIYKFLLKNKFNIKINI